MDFARYPEWNPFVRTIEGPAAVGATLKVSIQSSGGNAMTFRPTVLRHQDAQEFRWKGKLLVPGLFDGEHYFRLAANDRGSTLFTQGECFTGLLVPLFRRALDRGTRPGFEAM